MKKRQLFVCCFLFLALDIRAQNGLRYQATVATGLLLSDGLPWFHLQAVNALKYSGWLLGVGAGLEYYQNPATLIFVDMQKAFGKGRKQPFVYLDIGRNFPRRTESDAYDLVTDMRGGLYTDAGIGYQVPLSKKLNLFFAAGYSVKKYSTTNLEPAVIAVYPSPPPRYYDTDYKRERFGLKAGLRF